MRWIVGGKAVEREAASTSQMGRFETEWLASDVNLAALFDLPGRWIDRVRGRGSPATIVLDMDSSVSPTHGEQEGTAYNGHFAQSDHDKALDILAHLPNAGDYDDYPKWVGVIAALHAATSGSEASRRAAAAWSKDGGSRTAQEGVDVLYEYFDRVPPRADLGHLINEARDHGYKPYPRQRNGNDHKPRPNGEPEPEGGKAKANGAVFIRPGDQFADEYQPLVYIIDTILPKGTLTTITGAGNIGKTALGMLIAAHKANGAVLNGWEVTKGNVLYASAENTTDFRHRYIAMRDNWKDFAESHFHVMTSNERAGLTSNAEAIENYASGLGFTFDLIVVDTQAAWSPVEEEANNAEQLAYARALRRLCGLAGSPAVLVLSHPIKTPSKAAECRPRGGVAFENETDGNWTLWLNGELVEVAYTRLRVPRWEPFSIRIREIETTSVVDSKGRPLRSVRAEMASADEAKAAKASHAVKKFKWQQALDVLDNTLADYPEQPINRKRYPTAITLTRVERFKAALERAAIIDGESADTRRKQWNRIKDDLQTKGHLRIEGDLCWRTGT